MAKKAAKKKTGTAVAVHNPRQVTPGTAMTFLQFLDKASHDPDFDPAKFKAVLDMKEREDARNAKREFDRCMAEAQAAMQPIRTDMNNSQTKSRYASYIALDRKIRPIYSKLGFALSFDTIDGAPPEYVRVACYISCAGHNETRHIDMPADGKGAKGGDVMSKTHATGSAVTYGMRYLLKMIFNLVTTNEDDDGRAAAGQFGRDTGAITEAQVKTIQKLMDETKTPATRVLTYASDLAKTNLATLQDIPASIEPAIRQALLNAKARMTQVVPG